VGPGGYYHFPDYVADVAELVDALAPRRLAVVGHSMGGTVAALYAGSHHDRIERLALLEGMGPVATEARLGVDRMQSWLRTLRSVDRIPKPLTSLQEAVERLALHHPRVSREIIETRARLLTRADETGRLVWAYDPLHRTTAPTPFHLESFKEFLRRIDCPTLIVSGGPTGWHPPDEEERLHCLAHATRFELPQAGHMMHWTDPVALADRLSSFFGEPPPRKGQTRPGAFDSRVGTEQSIATHAAPPSAAPPSSPHAPAPAAPSYGRPVIPPTYVGPAAPQGDAFGRGPGQAPPLAPPAGQVPVGPTRPAGGFGQG
jgi:pimeloyl-ACP methyl ester carboxylesterase